MTQANIFSNIFFNNWWFRSISFRISSQIFSRISDKADKWFRSLFSRIFSRISVLNYSSPLSVIWGDIWWDTLCTTHLPAIYSILNHLPVCHIFNPQSPACLSDIRSWVTCLPARHSILNYLSAPRIQCFFALKMHRGFSAFLIWKIKISPVHDIYLPFQIKSQKKLRFINRISSLERQLVI